MAGIFLRLTRKWPEGAAAGTLRNIDAVSHKKLRSAYIRINQCFFNYITLPAFFNTITPISQKIPMKEIRKEYLKRVTLLSVLW